MFQLLTVLNIQESSSGGIWLTLLICGCIYFFLFCIFLWIRRKSPTFLVGLNRADPAELISSIDQAFPHPLDFNNMFVWWLNVVRYPLDGIEAVCGPEAFLYLRFQQTWLGFFGVASLASLLVFLPLNLHGGFHTATSFQDTTILHLRGDSPALWSHLVYLLSILAFSLWCLHSWRALWEARCQRSSPLPPSPIDNDPIEDHPSHIESETSIFLDSIDSPIAFPSAPTSSSSLSSFSSLSSLSNNTSLSLRSTSTYFQDCTVLLTGLPPLVPEQLDRLHHLLHHHYPDLLLLHPILDLRVLAQLHQEYRALSHDLDFYRAESVRTAQPLVIPHPQRATTFLSFHLCGPRVDAAEYAQQRLQDLRQSILHANDLAQDALGSGVAFLTFSCSAAALEFIYDIQVHRQEHLFSRFCICFKNHSSSSSTSSTSSTSSSCFSSSLMDDPIFQDPLSEEMQLTHWNAVLAPAPEDIFWPSLGMSPREHLLRTVVVNLLLFLIFLFWSTPAALLSSIDYFTELFGVHSISLAQGESSHLASFFLLLLMILTPVCLHLSSQLEGHNTFGDLEHFGMRKVFAFLVLTTFLLPSCVSTSASALLRVLLSNSWDQMSLVLIHAFPNSSMFVNFVLQVAFFATAFELLKLESHLLFFIKSRRVRSAQHLDELRQEIQRRPTFGFWYASLIAMMTVILCYAPLVPHMMPAGFIWLFLRHCTDKHNLMYLHQRQTRLISPQIVKTASSFLFIAVTLAITVLFAFLMLVKQALLLSFICILFFIPLSVYYLYLSYIQWPLIDEKSIDLLFENETPLDPGVCDIYLHPVGKAHREFLRTFQLEDEQDASVL